MSKRKGLVALFLLVLVCCGFGVCLWIRSSTTAEPILRLVIGAKTYPVDSVVQQGLPLRAYSHASVAVSRKDQFYLVTGKRDVATGQWEPNPSRLRPLSVLITEKEGLRVVPLRGTGGLAVRHTCDFLTVSPSGKRWWTGRRRHETVSDLTKGVGSETVLTAYDEAGALLQEWALPSPVDELSFIQAVGEEQAYVVDPEQKKVWVYKLGSPQPQGLDYPASWTPAIGASLVTDEGRFLKLHPARSGAVQIREAELGKPSRVLTTFQWHQKGFSPSLFWQDAKAGVFVFEHLREYDPTSTPPQRNRGDWAKAIYRIAADGQVHKLFETPDVISSKPAEQARTGQMLKADEHFVWFEVEYFKGNTPTEYQIVKVPYQ